MLHSLMPYSVLLDYRAYARSQNQTYDTATPHAFSLEDLRRCGESQGIGESSKSKRYSERLLTPRPT